MCWKGAVQSGATFQRSQSQYNLKADFGCAKQPTHAYATAVAPLFGPQVLQALGIKAAFDQADFSKASSNPLVLSNVLHSAVVQVDEAGTEAAAATAVITLKSAMNATPPKSLVSTLLQAHQL